MMGESPTALIAVDGERRNSPSQTVLAWCRESGKFMQGLPLWKGATSCQPH